MIEDTWIQRIEDVCLAHYRKLASIETLESFRLALTEVIGCVYLEGGYIVSPDGTPVESFDDVEIIVRLENGHRIHAVVVPSKEWQNRRIIGLAKVIGKE